MTVKVNGTVVKGHGVASGRSANSPYPQGSVAMQAPFFKALGLDLADCYVGTLNVATDAVEWRIVQPTHRFDNVQWTHLHPAETFSFVRCSLSYEVMHTARTVQAWLYYPHPETKAAHWQNSQVMEIIAPRLEGLAYGQHLDLEFADGAIAVDCA
jgi:hypothetical protein